MTDAEIIAELESVLPLGWRRAGWSARAFVNAAGFGSMVYYAGRLSIAVARAESSRTPRAAAEWLRDQIMPALAPLINAAINEALERVAAQCDEETEISRRDMEAARDESGEQQRAYGRVRAYRSAAAIVRAAKEG